jgi:hypothetical protein
MQIWNALAHTCNVIRNVYKCRMTTGYKPNKTNLYCVDSIKMCLPHLNTLKYNKIYNYLLLTNIIMKKIIILTLLLWLTLLNGIAASGNYSSYHNPEAIVLDQSPFSFMTNVPARIKITDKVNLSFFVNQSIVFQYRLKLEVPKGGEAGVDKSLLVWSGWNNKDINEIIIPKLGKEGKYKLIVEYRTHTSSETLKYEKLFDVYTDKPVKAATAQTKTASTVESAAVLAAVPAAENIKREVQPSEEKINREINTENATQTETESIPAKNETSPETSIQQTQPANATFENPVTAEVIAPLDYDRLLRESIETKDTELLLEAINNGAGKNFKGEYGGNIFHMLDEGTASDGLVSTLKSKGFSINEADDYGNSPLHYAILTGNSRYAKYLINQGANLNVKNNQDLSPLHIAVLNNNNDVVKDLLKKGTDVNLKGNSGYTPLHIASEMNHPEIASALLVNKASDKLKTDQGFTPKTIAKIQKNEVIGKLLSGKGSKTFSDSESGTISGTRSLTGYPKIDFTLAYDKELVKKRQTAKIIRLVSIPLFAVSTAAAVYFRNEANNYYSLYQDSENEEDAKINYDKTTQYDTYTYISLGVSLTSLYGFIHSTIWKKNVTNRMRKTF